MFGIYSVTYRHYTVIALGCHKILMLDGGPHTVSVVRNLYNVPFSPRLLSKNAPIPSVPLFLRQSPGPDKDAFPC